MYILFTKLEGLLKNTDRKFAQTFNSSLLDDVLSLNFSRFGDYLHWSKEYYWNSKVCFLPWPSHWNRQRRKIKKKLYDKHDDFTLSIVNFSFIRSNIPASPAYGV